MAQELLRAEDVGDDLNEIKNQIDTLLTQRTVHMEASIAEMQQVEIIDKNLALLRDKGQVLLGTKVDRSEGKTPKGEQERVATEDTKNTP